MQPGKAEREEGQKRQSPTVEPCLDFFSNQFDAALALRTTSLRPPRNRVKTLDTLQQCLMLLPPEVDVNDDEYERKTMLTGNREHEHERYHSDERMREQNLRRQRAIERGARIHRRARAAADEVVNMFDSIVADAKAAGPLSVLAIAQEENRRVRVTIRHRKGVRGVLYGQVVLFDQHFNMVMKDVDEDYMVRLRQGRKVTKKATRSSQYSDNVNDKSDKILNEIEVKVPTLCTYRPVLERRSRHMHQILIRGESIVMVSFVS